MEGARRMPTRGKSKAEKVAESQENYIADIAKLSPAALARKLKQMEAKMIEHAKNLEFEDAAALRDQVTEIKQRAFVS
jgi:excinuclease ABC subunit B